MTIHLFIDTGLYYTSFKATVIDEDEWSKSFAIIANCIDKIKPYGDEIPEEQMFFDSEDTRWVLWLINTEWFLALKSEVRKHLAIEG